MEISDGRETRKKWLASSRAGLGTPGTPLSGFDLTRRKRNQLRGLCRKQRTVARHPCFLTGVPQDSSAVVLIPDSESPAVWSPHTAGFWEMSWPKVPWLTVAMTFNPRLRASVIQADGKIMAGLFLWRPDDAAQDNAMLEINSGLQNCTSLRFSPSTDHLIAMSQTGMWIGQPLLSDNGILLASPLPKEASVLIVEQSGAIRKLPVQAATTNPDVKAPSANSGELLQQTAVLTAAAFRHSTGRLLVGTEDGRLV